MATRSDQLHSHQFAQQRVVAALALRDPDATTSPMRRIGGALLAGVMVAALAVAAAGVYGLLRPGSDDSWRDGNAVVIENETGARFVFRDGVLHPVLNYSSALLILGTANPPSAHVARAALVGVPRGVPLGIPGAPDLLPAPGDLVADPWTLCSRLPETPTAAAERAESILLVGATPADPAEPLDQRGLLGADPSGGLHLVWNSRRYAVEVPDLVLAALGWSRQMAVPVAVPVLNAFPPGPALGRISVERGDRASPVAGFRVGEVFVVESSSGDRRFGVALGNGLADITQVQADLLIADGANGLGGRPTEMGQALYASSPRAPSLVPTSPTALPATTPQLARPGAQAGICAVFSDGAAAPQVVLAASAPRPDGQVRLAPAAGDVVAPVDWVAVPPGRGAVVEAMAGPEARNGALGLVSDLGQRHPLASTETLTLLGYADVRPQRLPAAVVALLPAGHALDPVAALTPVTG
jgi:type VII secretion protein EccB